MIEIIVGFFLVFAAIFFFTSFYEIVLIFIGFLMFGQGLGKNKQSAKNPLSIIGTSIMLIGVIMLFAEFDEPGHSEEVAQQEAAEVKAVEDEKKAEVEKTAKEEEAARIKEEKEANEAEYKAEIAASEKEEENIRNAIGDHAKSCVDFEDYEEVISFWFDNRYTADDDPHNLDSNNDGLPCDVGDTTNIAQPGTVEGSDVYYDSCSDVEDAGAAPIRAGDPGYGYHLDRDEDGIACEI
ncbi:excalibur calcium-binding domain-containing protein [Planococcus kocurii]|uniref:excalibur calcium-binding domain-containing protein n=1 Tax=Planococcus kocurii TaxID=1374 RepID=UPI003CFEAE1C